MARSFGLVDYKVQEAEYFLRQLHEKSKSFNFGDIQFTTSAFVSAARSITFAMQGSLKGNTKFDDWYAVKQAELRGDALAKFFHDFRTVTQHLGINVVGGGAGRQGFHKFYFVACPDLQVVPEQDVLTACEAYFKSVLSWSSSATRSWGQQSTDSGTSQNNTLRAEASASKTQRKNSDFLADGQISVGQISWHIGGKF